MTNATLTGTAPASDAPRPDLNGYLLQVPGNTAVFWIDGGLRRWIPDVTTMQNLFGPNPTITPDIDLVEIPQGAPLTLGAFLAVSDSAPATYLIDDGVKRWIASGDAMTRANFDAAEGVVVRQLLLTFIPSGPDLT